MYDRETVYKETIRYFDGDELATNVWIDKYCLKNNGKYFELTPNDMHKRLAKEFARIENKYPNPMSEEQIFQLLKGFEYIVPQGSPMAGIGNNFVTTSISNCFVIDGFEDSYGGIMLADQQQVQLMKRRGGVGQDISYIRPSEADAGGSKLGKNAGLPLFMERFSNSTREVQQDGRRGALMLSIDIKHPDSEKFIDKKLVDGKVTGANISVRISDEFMECVKNNTPFYQTFPTDYTVNHISLSDNIKEGALYESEVVYGVQTYFKKIDARKLWNKIVYNAWKSAEPGILFWDTILKESPARAYGEKWKEKSTNPCGEIPLNKDSCRLLSINLFSFVYKPFTEKAILKSSLLKDYVKKAMRLMDDIVDLEIEKIDRILDKIRSNKSEQNKVEIELWENLKQNAIDGRRTGLGVLGEADLIAALGLRYGTKEATEFSNNLHQIIATAAYESSIDLAEERGAFPIWKRDDLIESEFLQRMFFENDVLDSGYVEKNYHYGRRNIGLLTIAPTGSTSLMTRTTSGIEPVFMPYHYRKRKLVDPDAKPDFVDENGDAWEEFTVFHKPFIQWYAAKRRWTKDFAKQDLQNRSEKEFNVIFEQSPYYRATAQDIDYIEKVRMQGAVQKWVDHSISVTVNMPENSTEEMVEQVYEMAYESGCKGITVYRENSRGNVLSTKSIKEAKAEDFSSISAAKRPKELECDVHFVSVRGEKHIVFVGLLQNRPYEVFSVPFNDDTKISKETSSGTVKKVKKGQYKFVSSNKKYFIENLCDHSIETEQNETRLVSALLRHRVDPLYIVNMLNKFSTISSMHKAISKVISKYIEDKNFTKCPECGKKMKMTEGCMSCPSCGYAHCG